MFRKIQTMKESWLLEIGGQIIPVDAVFAILRAIGITLLLFISMELGQLVQGENMKWLAKFQGIKDEKTGLYLVCEPVLNSTSIMGYSWNCMNTTKSSS